jgi:hypothetical protein
MSKYAEYKNRRKNIVSVIEKLKETNDEKSKKRDYSDPRFYQWKMDDSGNAFSVIRFLPSVNDLAPIVSRFRHSFQNQNRWYIKNCPTSIGEKCVVCESNSALWQVGTEDAQNIVRKRSRRKEYFANIYVVSDKANPEAEGRVFLFKFSQQIYEKIMSGCEPETEDGDPIVVFDPENGANFQLRVSRRGGYANYEKCKFSVPSKLTEDEDQLEKIFEQILPLDEFVAKDQFEPYAELKKRLDMVLGASDASNVSQTVEEEAEREAEPAPKQKAPASVVAAPAAEKVEELGDPDEFFRDM